MKNKLSIMLITLDSCLAMGWVRFDGKTVTPLFKKGHKSKAFSSTPISVTSVVYKMLESIIKRKLVHHLESQCFTKPSQHGFCTGRSCLTNLLEYLEYVTIQIDNRQPVDCVYLDFSKAFDKVQHQHLLVTLETMGIDGKVLKWIRDWLSNRKQRVILKWHRFRVAACTKRSPTRECPTTSTLYSIYL